MNNNNNNRSGAPAPNDQSALSLLVNAADHNMQRDLGNGVPGRSLQETLRLRGLAGDAGGASLEEQLLMQQQSFGNPALLAQLREQNILSQLGQQQHLASLLGLGGAAGAPGMRDTFAAQMRQQVPQQQQQQQLTHADLLALSRNGALPSLPGFLGGGLGGQNAGYAASELEGLQRMEELERRQRLLQGAGAAAPVPSAGMARPEDLQQQLHRVAPQASRIPSGEVRDEAAGAGLASPGRPERRPSGNADVASAPDAEGNDEVEKAPGSVIVPCRARGMPMDHNFKTAYFVIPENVKHGEELICSYFACRNAGIKFRYCSHCKVPVAKRNFRKRHKHGGEIIAGEDSGDEEEVKKGIPSQIMASREVAGDADALSSQSADSPNPPMVSEAEVQKGLVRNSMRSFEQANQGKTGTREKIGAERIQRWATLLAKRPSTKDGDNMSNWLMEVLAVSDLDTPLKPAPGAANPTPPAAPPARAESPQSEDSNEELPVGIGAKKPADGDNMIAGGIIKKKRPVEMISHQPEESNSPAKKTFAGGSFAEWKERKKQRKQGLVPGPSPAEGASPPS